jgi:Zn-dependent peptidase ImmA (M78 family)
MTQYSTPEAIGLSKRAIWRIAEGIAKALELGPGGDLTGIVQRLGGQIVFLDFENATARDEGSIEIEAVENFKIFLPPFFHRARDRFTIAHEIGHYVLHYLSSNSKSPMIAKRSGAEDYEREANWFAAALLMPEEEFRRMYSKHDGSLEALAAIFDVSKATATVRISELGLRSVN